MIVISLVLGVAIHDNQPNDNKYYEQIGSETKDITDEIPFDIPNNWEWVRLGNIVDICDNVRKPLNAEERNKKYKSGDVIYPYYGATGQVDTINNFIFDGTYVLLGEDGAPFLDAYATKAYKVCGKFWVNNHAHIMSSTINNDYLVFCLNITNYKEYVAGTTRLKLTQADMYMIPIPLPPLSEQKRIVSEIEKIFEQIEVVKTNQEELSKLKDGLKNKILDLAIQGKLVEQDPNDEPAAKLLEKIKAEKTNLVKQGKIKKDKQESFIFKTPDNRHYEKIGTETKDITDEIPFDVPESWCWVRLGSVCQINPRNTSDDSIDAAFIPMNLISDGFYNKHSYLVRQWKDIKQGFIHFANNDVGVAKITPCFENRKSVIFSDLPNGIGSGTTELHIVRPYCNILPLYILILCKSEYFISNGVKNFTGTAGQQRISSQFVKELLLPLPPINEQRRIIEKIKKLYQYANVL